MVNSDVEFLALVALVCFLALFELLWRKTFGVMQDMSRRTPRHRRTASQSSSTLLFTFDRSRLHSSSPRFLEFQARRHTLLAKPIGGGASNENSDSSSPTSIDIALMNLRKSTDPLLQQPVVSARSSCDGPDSSGSLSSSVSRELRKTNYGYLDRFNAQQRSLDGYPEACCDFHVTCDDTGSDSEIENGYSSDGSEQQPSVGSHATESLESASEKAIGNWNLRFQTIINAMRIFDEYTPLQRRLSVTRDLIHLAHDFIYTSASYGMIIVSELFLPEDQKTIKRTTQQFGGIAGGEKYLVHNIVFKFAADIHGLYGSDEAAAKAAGHELKGLLGYFNCGVKICLPLMALVDYRGYRLIAMSVLPINKLTMLYGSSDCGRSVNPGNEVLNSQLKIACERLNIKPHSAGMDVNNKTLLFTPIDMEGHFGFDGQYYLIDFSRVFPPQTPFKGVKGSHLFQLLRPEFVRNLKTPLCSDAFSGFIKGHPLEEEHNVEVVEATNHLLTEVIPEFATEFREMVKKAIEKDHLTNFRLGEALHRRGINLRFLGVLRQYVNDLDCSTLILVEMCARVVKNLLRKQLREKMQKLKLPVDEPYRRLTIDYLNLVFGEHESSENYWNVHIRTMVKQKFMRSLRDEEMKQNYAFKIILSQFTRHDIDGKYLMFCRLEKMSGLKFSQRLNKELRDSPNNWVSRGMYPFDDTDLKNIEPRVKHMNIVTHAQGYLFKIEGNMRLGTDPLAAQRFFKMALEKFEEALDTDPMNAETLANRAEVYCRLIELDYQNKSKVKFFVDHPRVLQATEYFHRALKANPKSAEILFQYAQLLERCDNHDEAEEFYLMALEANPNHVDSLKEYGNFLSDRGNDDDAEKLYVRCSEATRRLSDTMELHLPGSLRNADVGGSSSSGGSSSGGSSSGGSSSGNRNRAGKQVASQSACSLSLTSSLSSSSSSPTSSLASSSSIGIRRHVGPSHSPLVIADCVGIRKRLVTQLD